MIDGITFETPGAAAVLTYASDVVVRNAWFDGCRFGVFGGGKREELPARELAVAYNEHLPLTRASAEFLSYFQNDSI